jgi:uncharacterized protein involved in type VI secretion and phage assembly
MSVGRQRFVGRYRGVVVDNRDPSNLGRLRTTVPDVYGSELSGWALPSVPYAGRGVGLFLVPPVDALVWVEFEHGDPEYPVWTGCFWGDGEVPTVPAAPDTKILKTEAGSVTISDDPAAPGITIETPAGMKVVISSSGIEITTGRGSSVKLSGPQVSVNDGALEVT